MKKKKSWIIWMLCFLLLATALPVVDFTEVQAASTNTGFTGWKTSGSKKYYYKNGKKLTGLHKLGKYYYGFASFISTSFTLRKRSEANTRSFSFSFVDEMTSFLLPCHSFSPW